MSPIRRKIKRAAEPTEAKTIDAEYSGAEPGITGDEIALLIVLVIIPLGFGLAFLSSLNLPWEAVAVFIVVVSVVALFAGVYRLRRPATEKEPNPIFDPRSAWLMRSRHHIKRID